MAGYIREYYPQESVPDDQVLIEFDTKRQRELFKEWWREEGRSRYNEYVDGATEWDSPWDDDL